MVYGISSPEGLKDWRYRMGWTAAEAAAQLGLTPNDYAAYERGWAIICDPRKIPHHVVLACERLEHMKGEGAVDKSGKVG